MSEYRETPTSYLKRVLPDVDTIKDAIMAYIHSGGNPVFLPDIEADLEKIKEALRQTEEILERYSLDNSTE